MTAANTNRETARDYLYSLLNTALVGTGKPAKVMYGYPKADFQGQSPVVCLKSAGSEREQRSFGNARQRSRLYFDVFVFVLISDPKTTYDEAAAEDKLDLIEKTIADTIADNRTYTADSGVTYQWAWASGQRSEVDDVLIEMSGDEYLRERIPLEVLVFND